MAFADVFRSHMLTRNIRLEADLVDQLVAQLFDTLARTLLREATDANRAG